MVDLNGDGHTVQGRQRVTMGARDVGGIRGDQRLVVQPPNYCVQLRVHGINAG